MVHPEGRKAKQASVSKQGNRKVALRGRQLSEGPTGVWIPACAGMTGKQAAGPGPRKRWTGAVMCRINCWFRELYAPTCGTNMVVHSNQHVGVFKIGNPDTKTLVSKRQTGGGSRDGQVAGLRAASRRALARLPRLRWVSGWLAPSTRSRSCRISLNSRAASG